MPSTSSSTPSSSRPRSSWLHVALFTLLVYIVLFSTVCCDAMPVWKTNSQLSSGTRAGNIADAPSAIGEVPSRPETGELDSPDLILQRCLEADGKGHTIFVKTLCSLALMDAGEESRTKNARGVSKRGVSSDRSSFSAFNRFVHRLVQHANEVSDYQERLNWMQAHGLLDNDYNVISVPHETVELMRNLG